MSGEEDNKRDDPLLAAEYSLGLLEGEELLAARGKVASDQEFAGRKEWWDTWFAPLSDQVAGAEPSAEVWQRISAQVAGAPNAATAPVAGAAADNVVELQARVRRWQ